MACIFILIEVAIQIFGGIYYNQTPEFVWSLANAILTLVPLVFGLRVGLICLIPVAVSEIVWFCKLHTAGPLLHIVSFSVTVVILGFAGRKLRYTQFSRKVILKGVLYETFLLGEEALYHGLRMLFLSEPISWESVSGTFLSIANPLLLGILVLCCVIEKTREKE